MTAPMTLFPGTELYPGPTVYPGTTRFPGTTVPGATPGVPRGEWSAFARGTNYALTVALPIGSTQVVLRHMGLDKALLTTTFSVDRWEALAPGSGLALYRGGRQVFSGPVTGRQLTWKEDDNSSEIRVEAVGDEVLLADRLTFPDPLRAADDQTVTDYWTATGPASTAMQQLISDQAGATCLVDRRVPGLTLGVDPVAGTSRTWQGLFDNVLELLTTIAASSGADLGLRISSATGALTATVVAPRDLTGQVIFSADLSNVGGTQFSETAPTGTHVLVAGQGDLKARLRKLSATTDPGSTRWGRQVWRYADRRDTAEVQKLIDAGADGLADGQAGVGLSMTLLDSEGATYLVDWDLGDKVTVYVGLPGVTLAVVEDVVREVTLSVGSDGAETVRPAIGSVDARSYLPTPTQRAVATATRRVDALIRNK